MFGQKQIYWSLKKFVGFKNMLDEKKFWNKKKLGSEKNQIIKFEVQKNIR